MTTEQKHTPETNAFYRAHPIYEYEQHADPEDCVEWLEFARKLERQRDELADSLRELLAQSEKKPVFSGDGVKGVRDAGKFIASIDKARAALAKVQP